MALAHHLWGISVMGIERRASGTVPEFTVRNIGRTFVFGYVLYKLSTGLAVLVMVRR